MTIQRLTSYFRDLSHCRFGIYDFNFTLVGWTESMLHQQRMACATYLLRSRVHGDCSFDEWEQLFRSQLADFDELFETGLIPELRMRKLLRQLGIVPMRRWMADLIRLERDEVFRPTFVYQGVEEELGRQVDAGLKLGLCSNGNPNTVDVYSRHGLRPFFSATAFSCEIGQRKPAAKMYQAIVNRLGADKTATFYVGDGGDDEFVGLHETYPEIVAVRVRSPKVAKKFDSSPTCQAPYVDFTVDSITELSQLLAPATCTV